MTTTAERRPVVPRKVPAPTRPTGQSPLVPGAVAAGWALGAGLVAVTLPVLLVWAADGRSGAGSLEATRTALALWLLAHGAALAVPHGLVSLAPLGLTGLPLALLQRAGRHGVRQVGRVDAAGGARLVAAIAVPYAAVAALLALLTGTAALRPDPLRALAGALVVAALGAGVGVVREARLQRELDQLPGLARRLGVAAAGGVAVLALCGLVLVLASLLGHLGKVTALSGATGPGLVGGTGLVVLQLLYAPNAAMWGASWLAGPGFAVGSGTHVGPWSTTLGRVPAVPVLGALPTGGPSSVLVALSFLVPLAAGVLAAVLLHRRLPACSVRRAAGEGALVGPAAGVLALVLAFVSGGPLGTDRLAAVGPSPWQVALAVAVHLGVWSAVASAVLAYRRR